jgi:uncharacterized protein (DUF433 family)
MVKYQHLERRPDKQSRELFIRGAGIRASTIWHDLYISRLSPEKIASDRDLSIEAVKEALDYCRDHWEQICREKDREQQQLKKKGFFQKSLSVPQELPRGRRLLLDD